MISPRFVPPLLLAVLLVTRAFVPSFLSESPFESPWFSWLSWFVMLFVPLFYLSAWCLTPQYVAGINWLGRRGLVVPALFAVLVVGGIWFLDVLWNHLVASWCGPCPESHLLEGFQLALFGGS